MTLAVLGLPVVLAAGVFANILGNEFVYDEKWTLDRLSSFSNLPLRALLHSGRGLTYLVHLLDRAMWGTWAPGFHLTNIVLHCLASCLAACTALFLTRSHRVGMLCGLLFAVHPVHVEAVAVFAYRKDILATIFVFLGVMAWVKVSNAPLRHLATLPCLGLGLISKEVVGIGLIPIILLTELLPGPWRRAQEARSGKYLVVFIATVLVLGVLAVDRFAGHIRGRFTSESIRQTTEGSLSNYQDVVVTILASAPHQVRLLFFPVTLCADHYVEVHDGTSDSLVIAGVLVLFLWVLGFVALARRSTVLAFAMAWTLLTYVPSSNIVPVTNYFVAERYLYLPSFGVCLIGAVALDGSIILARHNAQNWLNASARGLAVVLILAFSGRSFLRTFDWRDEYDIWSAALRDGYESWRIHSNLGEALRDRGELNAALEHARAAKRLNPNMSPPYILAGAALSDQGKLSEALSEHRLALRLGPGLARAHGSLAITLLRLGRFDEGAEECRQTIRLDPDDATAYVNLGYALNKLGRLEESATASRQAIRLDALCVEAYFNLGVALTGQEKFREAIEAYRKTLEIRENFKAAANLALLLATCPQTELRDVSEAVRLAKHACDATNNSDPQTLRTLATAFQAAGDCEEANRAFLAAESLSQ